MNMQKVLYVSSHASLVSLLKKILLLIVNDTRDNKILGTIIF
jgi:hypothetical protein